MFSQNLVPNPSFENYSQIPQGFGHIGACDNWQNVGGNSGTSDYYHINALLHTGVSLPDAALADLYPRTDSAVAGIISYSTTNWFEYITTELSSSMLSNVYYKVSFWTTNGDSNHMGIFGVNKLGFNLSHNKMSQGAGYPSSMSIEPTYHDTSIIWSADWVEISNVFKVDSTYSWLTIGVFHNISDIDTAVLVSNPIPHGGYSTGNYFSYHFIDDVEVIPYYEIIDTSWICIGDSVPFPSVPDTNYYWIKDIEPSQILATNSSIQISPVETSTYFAITPTDTLQYIVYVDEYPIVDLGPSDTNLCDGDMIMLQAFNSDVTYLWQDSLPGGAFLVDTTGTYWVEVNRRGCKSRDTINVYYHPNPTVDLGPDQDLCEGDTIEYNASFPGATYLWRELTSNTILSYDSVYVVDTAGIYDVYVYLGYCSARWQVEINYYNQIEVDLGNDTVLCEGERIIIGGYNPNATSYLWNDGETAITYDVGQSGMYWLFLDNAAGCSNADTIYVEFDEALKVNLGEDRKICDNQEIVLNVQNDSAAYTWQDQSLDSIFIVTEPGVYWVSVERGECSESDTVFFESLSITRI